MRTIIILSFCLFLTGAVQAPARNASHSDAGGQIGSSISADGTVPNDNAMLDIQSPSTGDGKGMLIPRVTQAQRTTANASLAGGLLDNSGNLRGGAAQGLIVYQTDGVQGLFFNTSLTAAPTWSYLGDVTGLLASNVWAVAGSTTNYLPRTGGSMSGALNMDAQIVTNVANIDFNATNVSVGRGANSSDRGTAVGYLADGSYRGAALGYQANGSPDGAAMGREANAWVFGAAVGYLAQGAMEGAAIGHSANGSSDGAAVGSSANGYSYGAALGRDANGSSYGAAVGYDANGSSEGVALGKEANGYNSGSAVGYNARGTPQGAALGRDANGSYYGAAVGQDANGSSDGAAVGGAAKGYFKGAAMGYYANGARTNVAIGAQANAQGGGSGVNRIAIGYQVTNNTDNSARIRGDLYLDGGANIYTNAGVFGSANWGIKAFEIDHPLDPENKVLRHFCLEGPQVWNVYAGNVQLVNGQAVVQLPDYYSALNLVGSEIYGLTPLGDAFVWIVNKVSDNRFVIAGKQDIEVSWTIKVLRNDPGCLEDLRRRPVEQLKSEMPR